MADGVFLAAVLLCGYSRIVSGYGIQEMAILPDTNQTVITSGDKLRLECSSKKFAYWLPPEGRNDSRMAFSYKLDDQTYKTTLEIQHTVFTDTGYYKCIQNNSNSDFFENSSARIYVYVKDDQHLLVKKSEFEWLDAKQYHDVTLPCIPTSPEVKVTLEKEGIEVMEQDISYDPTIGFTFTVSKLETAGLYTCIAQLGVGTVEKSQYLLHIKSYTQSVRKPDVTDATKMHIEVGDSLNLRCWAQVDKGTKYILMWFYPDKRNTTDHSVSINEIISAENGIHETKTFLTISNVTYADEGIYTCVVKDHNQLTNNASTYLTVYEKNTTYLNISLQGSLYSLEQHAGDSVQWVVHITAHPEPEINWYDPYGEVITNTTSHGVASDRLTTTLVLSHIKIDDTGNYTIVATNNAGRKELQFTLHVLDHPVVTLLGKDLYMYNQSYKIHCSVVGLPKPTVKWFYRECRIPHECNNLPVTKYHPTSYTPLKNHNKSSWESTLSIPAAVESGQITCWAENTEGVANETMNFIITDIPYDEIWLTINDKNYNSSHPTVEQDNVTLHCGVPVANYTSQVVWLNGKDGSPIENTTEFKVLNTSTKYSYRSSIHFPNISKNHGGLYICKVTKYDDDEQDFNYEWNIEGLVAPEFVETNAKQDDWSVLLSEKVEWTCKVSGRPLPAVKWYKDEKPLTIRANDSELIKLYDNNMSLKITAVRFYDDGTYRCEASNNGGKIYKSFVLKTRDKTDTTGLIAGIAIMAIVFIVAVVIFIYKFREAQKFKRELIAAGLNHFEDGAMDNFNPELPIDEQADLLPYDKKWEFPRDKLKLGRQLGAGAFGVVRKAEAWGIVEGETVTTVAVKMVKSADFAYIKALASELKIMLHLGKHLNVVNLLGACTKDLNKKEFLVIVEFCRYGNLHNYLMRHRDRFIDQIDFQTGKIDYTIGSELLARSTSVNSSKSKVKYAALSFSNHSGGSSPGEAVTYSAEPSSPVPRSPGVNSDMSVCMTPTGDEESPMLSNNSVQPGWRSNFHGDYKQGNVRAILTRDLLCWSFQVSRGMEYLAGRKVMHGDLAARNILLADDNIVKICDFGLAKSMYKSDNYKKKGDSPLPVKWMAIEAIRDRIFSTQSDVWSFGIVLWELFSLARTPYPGMEADEKLYNNLLNGYRMECPQYATREIYQVMQDCWQPQPNQRPSFTELSEQLGALLEESVRAHYIDLNDPYIAMNSQMMENRNDYLNMMSAPTYDNLMSPSFDEPEHHYVNSPAAANQIAEEMNDSSGYLKMKGASTTPPHDAVIFSPRAGSVKGNIFSFATPPAGKRTTSSEGLARNERPTLGDVSPTSGQSTPSNNLKLPSLSDGQTQSFSNPNYVGAISPLSDNYVNISQEKKDAQLNKDKSAVNVDEPNNQGQNYLFMGKNNNISNINCERDVPKSFSNPNYISNNSNEKERYVQFVN